MNQFIGSLMSLTGCILLMAGCSGHSMDNRATPGPMDYVQTVIGSQSDSTYYAGNTYPAVARPWGMNLWTAQTNKGDNKWIYSYSSNEIYGFRQTHQPSPCTGDYGQFSIMPVTGKPVFEESARVSRFSHKDEVAKPHYYKTFLSDHHVVAEMTASERAAALRFTYQSADDPYVVLDAFDSESSVTILPEERKIIGFSSKNNGGVPANFRNYFVVEFDRPFTYIASVCNGDIQPSACSSTSGHSGAIVGFKIKEGDKLNIRVSSSFISEDQAERNLLELGADSFDNIVDKSCKQWAKLLGRVEIIDNDIDNLRMFYSCLYRTLLTPHSFYEYDDKGEIIHYSPYNGLVCKGYMIADIGFHEAFRSLLPLINLLFPSRNEIIQESLVNAYKESGFIPEWLSPGHRDIMLGNSSASSVADAYLSGIKNPDIEILWDALIHGTKNNHPVIKSSGRYGSSVYNTMGYIPCDINIDNSTLRTLEYAYNDWCIYKLGKIIGKSDTELAQYAERALNYKNLFDSKVGLIHDRVRNGQFTDISNLKGWDDNGCFSENWHHTWSVFHDMKGLISLMGGNERFNAFLDSVFNKAWTYDKSFYNGVQSHSDVNGIMLISEILPIQHIAYLYNYSGTPWKAQNRVREYLSKMYSPTPDGYCGNEGNGQSSALFVFSSLGFYPVCPASGQYVIGSPLFKHAKVNLENGNIIEISAPGNSDSNRYVSQLRINGHPYAKNYVNYTDLVSGINMDYDMSDIPNLTRGIAPESSPYSFSDEQ